MVLKDPFPLKGNSILEKQLIPGPEKGLLHESWEHHLRPDSERACRDTEINKFENLLMVRTEDLI